MENTDHSSILEMFKAHEERDSERFEEINNTLKEIRDNLKPITDVYTSVSLLGKWAMGGIVFVSIIVGIVVAVVQLFNRG